MDLLPDFTLHRPSTAAEAVALHAGEARARYLAGGTDLIVNLRRGLAAPERVIDVSGVAELQTLHADDRGLTVGAGVTLARLCREPAVSARWPVLTEAAATIAGPTHRAAATVGGNLCLDTRCLYYNQSAWWREANGHCLKLGADVCRVAPTGNRCHAAYSGDLAPALLALGARVRVSGPAGERELDLAELYHDDGAAHLALTPGELLHSVFVPAPTPGLRAAYAKARVRDAIDFPLAGVAVALRMDAGRIAELAVACTGTNPRPLRVAGVEELYGQAVDEGTLKRLETLVKKQLGVMRTTLATQVYRRRVACGLTRRLVASLASG